MPPTWWCTLYDGLGRGLAFSKRSRRARHWVERGWEFARVRLAFADAHFKCISVLYKFPRRAVSRSTRLGIEKGSAASKAAQKGKVSEHMTTNRRPGKTYLAF